MGEKPAMRVKWRAEDSMCPGLGMEGWGSGLYKVLKEDPHSQQEWQARTRTWLDQEKGFDVFLFGWLICFVLLFYDGNQL